MRARRQHQTRTAATHLARTIVDRLHSALIVVDAADRVVLANPAAVSMRLLTPDATELSPGVLRNVVTKVRHTGCAHDVEVDLPHTNGRNPLGVRVQAARLDGDRIHLEVEDVTEAHRVARVRRDFVTNVSHELKTPVGALQLLSEALSEAADDPVSARRFSERIHYESTRLGRLVNELIELSRLQGAEPLPVLEPVNINRVIGEVLDRSRITAAGRCSFP